MESSVQDKYEVSESKKEIYGIPASAGDELHRYVCIFLF